MLGKKLGIDLGSTAVRVFTKGDGMVFSEPPIAGGKPSGTTAVGLAALDALDGGDEMLRRPIDAGMIVDSEALAVLLGHAVTRAVGRQRIFKPDIVIAIASALPGEQRRALLDIATRVGARTVYLLDAPLAAAIGSGMALTGSEGHLVADSGGGKTDVAVLALEGTIASRFLPHGTTDICDAIVSHVRDAHDAQLTPAVAAELLSSLAYVGKHEERRQTVQAERDGVPVHITITSFELELYLEEHARALALAINEVVEEVPSILHAGIRRRGIVLTGGGARLEGLARYLTRTTGLAVNVPEEPELRVLRGAALAVENLDVLRRSFMYIR